MGHPAGRPDRSCGLTGKVCEYRRKSQLSILPRASCAGTAANSRSQPLRRLDRHRRGEGPTAGLPLRNASRHVVGRDPGFCSIANAVTSTDSARRPLWARNGRGDTGTDYRAGGIGRCRAPWVQLPSYSPISRRAASSGLRPRLPLSSELRFGMNSGAASAPTVQPEGACRSPHLCQRANGRRCRSRDRAGTRRTAELTAQMDENEASPAGRGRPPRALLPFVRWGSHPASPHGARSAEKATADGAC